MNPNLGKEQLERISDDLLDRMVEDLAKNSGFDTIFYGLEKPLMAQGYTHLFGAIEERVNLLLVKIAEEAFKTGHKHGYGTAILDMVTMLQPALTA